MPSVQRYAFQGFWLLGFNPRFVQAAGAFHRFFALLFGQFRLAALLGLQACLLLLFPLRELAGRVPGHFVDGCFSPFP